MCVGSDGQPKGACKAKICQLQVVVLAVYEEVLRLQISMQDSASLGSEAHVQQTAGSLA